MLLRVCIVALHLTSVAGSVTAQQHTRVVTPLAGPASGGTILTASILEQCHAEVCVFRTANGSQHMLNNVSMSRTTSSASCTVPNATSVGAAAVSNWSILLASAVLYGSATRRDTQFELTSTDGFRQSGSALFKPPLEPSHPGAAAIHVAFELLVGRGTRGEGVNIFFRPEGRTSTTLVNDAGFTDDGLALFFETLSGHLKVYWRGTLLRDQRLDGIHPTVRV